RVSTVSADRLAIGHWSRASRERILLAGPESAPDAYVERLSEVVRRGGYDVVLPGTEASLVPISERRTLIEPYARLGLPVHDLVLRAFDKRVLHRCAAEVGLAPPRSILCSNRDEVDAASRALGLPLVLKPVRSLVRA